MSKRKQQRITAIKINMYQLYLTASKNKENLTEKKTNYGNKSSKGVHKWESRISSNRDNFNFFFSTVNYH